MSTRYVLLLITDLELGGTPTVVRELAIRLRGAGVKVQVACLGRYGAVAQQIEAAGVKVTALGARGSRDLRVLPSLIQLIRRERFDTVFSFLIHANAVAAAASLWLRDVRWIQSIQTTQPRPRWHWLLQRLVHRAAEVLVVPSPSVAMAAGRWSGIPAEKIVIIPNAINLRDFENSLLPESNPRPYPILFIGRLDPIKNIPTLIAAVALLNQLVHLHIWGEGSERGRIEEEIKRQDLSGFVTMHGAVSRPQIALAQSGLLVLPSLAEGFGLVLIEAMAAGVPVVATNVAGIRDVIRSGETGILVAERDVASLAKGIRQVVEDSSFRRRLIAAAAEEVRRRFTWDLVFEQYRELLGIEAAKIS